MCRRGRPFGIISIFTPAPFCPLVLSRVGDHDNGLPVELVGAVESNQGRFSAAVVLPEPPLSGGRGQQLRGSGAGAVLCFRPLVFVAAVLLAWPLSGAFAGSAAASERDERAQSASSLTWHTDNFFTQCDGNCAVSQRAAMR